MKRESGQALVVTLALMSTLVGALLLVFNVGQMVNAKQRLINASDAAAYSVAVWEARGLNYQAYLNRAVIANEAAVAQSVSLRSWSSYMNTSLTNMNSVLQFVPYVGAATRALSRVWWRVDAALQPALLLAETGLSDLNHGYATAGEAMHAATVAGVVPLVHDIARRGGARAELTAGGTALLAENARHFTALTRRYSGSARGRQADIVLRSRDRFTRDRPWNPVHSGNFVPIRLLKRGGTNLLGFDQWQGMDTFALHRRRYIVFGGWRESIQIGWGAAQNGRGPARRGEHGGSWSTNPRTSARAERSIRRSLGYRGIPALRDMDVARDRRSIGELRIGLELARSANSLPLTARVLPGAQAVTPARLRSSFEADDVTLRAISEAQVVFDRPEGRRDGRREYANIFNPYWRARLAPVSGATRAVAAAANGVTDPFVGTAP